MSRLTKIIAVKRLRAVENLESVLRREENRLKNPKPQTLTKNLGKMTPKRLAA